MSAPFHCELMAPARDRLRPELEAAEFGDPGCPIIANVDAQAHRTGATARMNLVAQVTAPVRWEASVRRMGELGAQTFLEIGPGRVLCGLIRRILPEARALNVEDPASLEKTLAALGSQG